MLYKAMFSIAVLWNWRRWAATFLLAFEGIARIGEVLEATRADLVLPSDSFEPELRIAYMRVRKPKSRRRGKGRIQHIRIQHAPAVDFLEDVFGRLDSSLKFFSFFCSGFPHKMGPHSRCPKSARKSAPHTSQCARWRSHSSLQARHARARHFVGNETDFPKHFGELCPRTCR